MAAFGAPSHADAAKVKIIGVQSEKTIIDADESLLPEISMQFSGWQRSHNNGQAPLRGQAHKQPGIIVTKGASGQHGLLQRCGVPAKSGQQCKHESVHVEPEKTMSPYRV